MHPHSLPRSRHRSHGRLSRMKSPVGHIRRKLCIVMTTGTLTFLHSLKAAGEINGYRLCTFTTSGFSLSNASRIARTPDGHHTPFTNPLIFPARLSRAPAVVMRSCATSQPLWVIIAAILSTTASSPEYLP